MVVGGEAGSRESTRQGKEEAGEKEQEGRASPCVLNWSWNALQGAGQGMASGSPPTPQMAALGGGATLPNCPSESSLSQTPTLPSGIRIQTSPKLQMGKQGPRKVK